MIGSDRSLLEPLQAGLVVVEYESVVHGEFGDELDRAVHSFDHDVEVRSRHRALFGDALLEPPLWSTEPGVS